MLALYSVWHVSAFLKQTLFSLDERDLKKKKSKLRIQPNENCFGHSHAIGCRSKKKKNQLLLIYLFIHLSISFPSNVKKRMSSLILQVVNLFREKIIQASHSLFAKHLGTGNIHLIHHPIAYRLCKEKRGLILFIKCPTSI